MKTMNEEKENPVYSEITAIGHDLYLCKKGNMSGEVLNGKGMKVK